MATDQIFEGRAERFKERIYGTAKGQLRLELVWRDMCEQLPLQASVMDVWDAGGGLGQMSQRLAELGHRVILSEPSMDMLMLARQSLPASVDCRQETLQSHTQSGKTVKAYDLIVCHAVLEWLADPREALQQILPSLRPGAYLSLLFYNVNAIALANMVKGNLYKVSREDFSGMEGGFTPPSPQKPDELLAFLQSQGMEIVSKRSVRFAYDLMARALREQRSVDDVMALEWQYGAREPYWQLGRYVHFVCRAPFA